MWSEKEIKKHFEAAKILLKLKDDVFSLVRKENVSEYQIQKYILKKYKENGLITDNYPPIVAFGNNTAKSHYFNAKKSVKARQGTLVIVDLWAAIPSYPFADITWVAYKGRKIPKGVTKAFNVALKTRDDCFAFIKNKLKTGKIPTGREVYGVTEKRLSGKTDDDFYTGHSIGFTSPHGKNAHLSLNNNDRLKINQAYAIEPSVLMKNKFRVRIETNFYISKEKKLVITAGLQNKIVKF